MSLPNYDAWKLASPPEYAEPRDPEPADECDAHGKRDCAACWEPDGEDREGARGDYMRERSVDR